MSWRREMCDGKLAKVPYNPKTGKRASSTNPKTWGTFLDALSAMSLRGHDGIGYTFAENDPYAGVDLDHCRDKDTGEIVAWARLIIDTFASYAELSPSGAGVHIIVKGCAPKGARHKRGNYEAYGQKRYFTITGQHLEDTPTTIEERQGELEDFIAEYLTNPESKRQPKRPAAAPTQPIGETLPLSMNDEELLMRARNNPDQAKAARFQRLFEAGDTSGYKSQSEADAALCNDLTYMCGPNAEDRVASLFRRSALYREKGDRDDYMASTIALAYAGRTSFYTPRTIEKSIQNYSIEKTTTAFSADVLEALDADAPETDENQLIHSLPEVLARIRELEHENASLRRSIASMNGKLQDIRNIIDADGLQVAPLEKVLEIDLLLHTIWPSHTGRRDPDGFVPILIETPRDPETGEKIKGSLGLADKHGVSRGTISKALDNLNAFGGCRVEHRPAEVCPNGTFRSRVLVAPPVCLHPKEWVRPDGPRKQMGGARPGAGRKAKCLTPGCDGELVERRGVETKEHEFIETRCTGICGEVTRHYTGVVTLQDTRYHEAHADENQLIAGGVPEATEATGNQLIMGDADTTRDGGDVDGNELFPPPSVDASIVCKIENQRDQLYQSLPPAPSCPTCGGAIYCDPFGRFVCRTCLVPIASERVVQAGASYAP